MTQSPGARLELEALCARGLDWQVDPSRMLADPLQVRRAAVLVLFGVLDGAAPDAAARQPGVAWPEARDLDVLLQRRAPTMGHHPGQIAFPGGGVDATDVDAAAAALREAVEETGLDPAGVEILGSLPELALPVSNNLVTPVPAWWTRTSQVAAVDVREAVEVFRVPVAQLLDPAHRATVAFSAGGRTVRIPAFTLDGSLDARPNRTADIPADQTPNRTADRTADRTLDSPPHGTLIWGFTAIVLSRMFDELGWAVPWDTRRTVEI